MGIETPKAVRALLWGGVVAGPFYLAVGLAQALTREGFDLARHPLSVLANGPGGWVQTANFVLTAVMVIGAAVAFWRWPSPRMRGAAVFLALYGAGMLGGAMFPADPADGFPPGTPTGMPAAISPTGLAHFAFGMLGFVSVAVSAILAGVAWRRTNGGLSAVSLASGLAVIAGFFGGFFLPSPVAGIWFAVVVGWAWLSFLSLRLIRT